MSVTPIELSELEQEQLRRIIKKSCDWRERDRSETIFECYRKDRRFLL